MLSPASLNSEPTLAPRPAPLTPDLQSAIICAVIGQAGLQQRDQRQLCSGSRDSNPARRSERACLIASRLTSGRP